MKKASVIGLIFLALSCFIVIKRQLSDQHPNPSSTPGNVGDTGPSNSALPGRKADQTPRDIVVGGVGSQPVKRAHPNLISAPSSQVRNTDGLLLSEDLLNPDGSIRLHKKYFYSRDKILSRELEIDHTTNAITTVDYIVLADGTVQVRVTDENGVVTIN